MTASVLDMKNQEDDHIIQSITSTIKCESVNYLEKITREDSNNDYEKIINMTTLSMKMFSTSHYKKSAFLDINEVEQIKESIISYSDKDRGISNLKQELINDLTEFQKQIKTNYVERISDMEKQKKLCEKQAMILEYEKNKLIMDRLSKIVWPYDQKTKEYDAQIEKLQIQVQKYQQKITEMQQTKPIANEKDILIYQIKIKEKYKKI